MLHVCTSIKSKSICIHGILYVFCLICLNLSIYLVLLKFVFMKLFFENNTAYIHVHVLLIYTFKYLYT